MHAIFGSQFRHRALALNSFQRHESLEARIMVPAFPHALISSFLQTSRPQIVASVTVRFSGSSSVLDGAGIKHRFFRNFRDLPLTPEWISDFFL